MDTSYSGILHSHLHRGRAAMRAYVDRQVVALISRRWSVGKIMPDILA